MKKTALKWWFLIGFLLGVFTGNWLQRRSGLGIDWDILEAEVPKWSLDSQMTIVRSRICGAMILWIGGMTVARSLLYGVFAGGTGFFLAFIATQLAIMLGGKSILLVFCLFVPSTCLYACSCVRLAQRQLDRKRPGKGKGMREMFGIMALWIAGVWIEICMNQIAGMYVERLSGIVAK